jgi:hypothetical protein
MFPCHCIEISRHVFLTEKYTEKKVTVIITGTYEPSIIEFKKLAELTLVFEKLAIRKFHVLPFYQ